MVAKNTTKKTTKKTKAVSGSAKNAKKQDACDKHSNVVATIAAALGLISLLLVPATNVQGLSPLMSAVACLLVLVCIIRGEEGWKVTTAAILSIVSFAMVVMMQWMMEMNTLDASIDAMVNEKNTSSEVIEEEAEEEPAEESAEGTAEESSSEESGESEE